MSLVFRCRWSPSATTSTPIRCSGGGGCFASRRAIPGSAGSCGPGAAMIPVPSGVRVWLASGVTNMRRGMNTLALQVQEDLGRDPHAGDLFVFRGRKGDLLKILWHDGLGTSLYAKRLERGRFLWPSPADGAVSVTAAQLGYLLEASTDATRFGPGGRLGSVELRHTVAWASGPSQELPGGGGRDSLPAMTAPDSHDTETLKPALAASEARAAAAEEQIAALTLMIEKLRRARPRTSWRPRRLRPGAPRSRGSSAASRRASPSPSICRASVWWCRGPRPVPAADRTGCRRSARM